MAGGITYADLRFARSPPEKSQGEEPNEGELTYENLQAPRVVEEEVAERGLLKRVPELPCWATSCHCWRPVTSRPMLGLLVLCLFLVATNIVLGVQYLQASRQLQEASREHAAQSHVLGERTYRLQAGLEKSRQQLRLTEQGLNSTKEELNFTTVALWQSRAAENRTRRQLQHQALQANRSLAVLRREQASLEANLSRATSCGQIGCCPRGWTLFRWKCLWASSEWKTWGESNWECKRMSSRLLVLPEPWSARELWEAVGGALTQTSSSWHSKCFWVGLWKSSETKKTWKWVDGSPYRGSENLSTGSSFSYAAMVNGRLSEESSWRCRFICERAAGPEDPPWNDGLWMDF